MRRSLIALSSAAIIAALTISACSAPSNSTPNITVSDAKIRRALPGQTTAMGTLTIENSGGADVLLSVASPVSRRIELHTHIVTDDGVMQMRRVEMMPIAAKSTLTLKSGGEHLMIFNAVIGGDAHMAPLTLTFKNSGDITVKAMIIEPGQMMNHSAH
jgi:copper(I)-binding protein